jgi:hypothetical protein
MGVNRDKAFMLGRLSACAKDPSRPGRRPTVIWRCLIDGAVLAWHTEMSSELRRSPGYARSVISLATATIPVSAPVTTADQPARRRSSPKLKPAGLGAADEVGRQKASARMVSPRGGRAVRR